MIRQIGDGVGRYDGRENDVIRCRGGYMVVSA